MGYKSVDLILPAWIRFVLMVQPLQVRYSDVWRRQMRPTSPTQHRGRETSSKCESSCELATVSNAYVEGCGTSITPREELNSLSPWVSLTCAVDIIARPPVAEDEKRPSS
jgi:hypothetical protein